MPVRMGRASQHGCKPGQRRAFIGYERPGPRLWSTLWARRRLIAG